MQRWEFIERLKKDHEFFDRFTQAVWRCSRKIDAEVRGGFAEPKAEYEALSRMLANVEEH